MCDGSPLDCRIFIVGTNSARKVEKRFWSLWSDSRGFKKAELIRELDKLSGGRTKTRKNMEIVAQAAGPEITLDTNIWLQPTRTVPDLPKDDKNTDVIEYLLKTIRPRIVLAHGGKAKKFFKKHCRDFVDDSVTPRKITWDAWQWHFRLLCSYHLSFQGKGKIRHAEEAERIGQAVADALRLTTPTR